MSALWAHLGVAALCLLYVVLKEHSVTLLECGRETKQRGGGCSPAVCGRFVFPHFIGEKDADVLRLMFENVIQVSPQHGGSGPPTIWDVTSGALSSGTQFVDAYRMASTPLWTPQRARVYKETVERIQKSIQMELGLNSSCPMLTSPTFFSRIDASKTAITPNDEYWHSHVDKTTYGTFTYTGLLYLSDHQSEFTGGRFMFDSHPVQYIAPRKGTLLWFTSGSENAHHVERLQSGKRYALTISFTCDEKHAVDINTILERASV